MATSPRWAGIWAEGRQLSQQLVPADVRGRELKLGSGGLRDVEFAVQLLQLVHGRSDQTLHVASTVDALAALSEGGYIGREDAANMTASYEFLRLLGLWDDRHGPVSSYSKGMRQKILLSAALLDDPDILILDEPFSGLDVSSALVLRRVIQLLAGRGKAVFFSSPVLEQADKLCTHLVVLNRGSVVASGPIAEMHAGFAGLDLEAGFMQLTEQVDVDHVARNIIAAVAAAR